MAQKRKDSKGRNLEKGESQRKDGRYQFRWTDIIGKEHTVYASSLSALRTKKKAILRSLDDGIDYLTGNKMSLDELIEEYIQTKTIRYSTLCTYLNAYSNFCREKLGFKKIATIRYSDILKLYVGLLNDGYTVTAINNLNSLLHPAFDLAVRNSYVRSNPTHNAMNELKKSTDTKKNAVKALTVQEQDAFVDFVANSLAYRKHMPLITVFLGTGMRVSELIGLTWHDIDFKKGIIHVNHSLQYRKRSDGTYGFFISAPKTEKGTRIIPMLPEVRKALILERQAQFERGMESVTIDGYSDFVFTNKNGNALIPSGINDVFRNIVQAYNRQEQKEAEQNNRKALLLPNISCHVLRHTFCTRFCENDTNVKMISEIMGHSTIRVTLDIYTDAQEEAKRSSMDNLVGKIKIS